MSPRGRPRKVDSPASSAPSRPARATADSDRARELERRAVFQNVKSVTPQGKVEKDSTTPTGVLVGE